MKDRLMELQEMILVNDSLHDIPINIPVIRNRKRRISSELLNCFRNDENEATSMAAINQSTSMEDFVVQQIRENINLIDENVNCIKMLHTKILSNPSNNTRAKQKLEEVTERIENSINIILENMKLIENNILQNVDVISKAQLTIRRNQSAILSRKFFEVMSNFNEAERLYQENLKNITQNQNTELDHNTEAGTSDPSTNASFMDEFFIEVEYARYILEDLLPECVKKVRKLHSAILSNPVTDHAAIKELHEVTVEIEHLANTVMEKLTGMNNSIMYGDGTSGVNLKIRKNHFNLLLSIFVETMLDYNNWQQDYHERCKGRIQRQLDIAGKNANDKELEEMLESGNEWIFTQGIITDTQQARTILQVDERPTFTGYRSRNDMQRDILYLQLLVFCINYQMIANDKSLEQWITEN